MMHPHSGRPGPHGHGGFGHGRLMGMGSQVSRGEVRPSVVALLKERDMHGYQIIQELAERSGGAWNPSPGSIYPILQQLEDEGMVTSEKVGGKRVFSLTDAGRQLAETLPAEAPWDVLVTESDPTQRLRKVFHALMVVTSQVGRVGSPTQIEKTADILAEARKRIYQQLADDDQPAI